jgi:hypothetical protein
MNETKNKEHPFTAELKELRRLVDEKVKPLPDGDKLFSAISKVFESGAGNSVLRWSNVTAKPAPETRDDIVLSVASHVLLTTLRAKISDGEISAFIHSEAPWCFYMVGEK